MPVREAAFCAEFAREMSAAGSPTPAVVETPEAEGGFRIAYAWMDGRYPLDGELDFEKLGRAVARFQAAIWVLAGKWPLEQETAARLDRFR